MPGGKYGAKQVFDDDYDFEDDYYDEDEEEEYDEPEGKIKKTMGGVKSAQQATQPGPKTANPDQHEYDDFINELLTGDVNLVQENKEKVPEDHVKVNGSQSAMFDWLTGPPPPQPSGRPQNSGRAGEAQELAERISAKPPAHDLSSDIQRFTFNEPSPDEAKSQRERGSKTQSWLSELATPLDDKPGPAQSRQTSSCQPMQAQSNSARDDAGENKSLELDENGWQRLPLHVEMEMLQQAAHGEDGVNPLHTDDKPRDRWWKQDRARRPDTENGEPSLREQRKRSPTPERSRRPLSEYVMEPDLKRRCDEAAKKEAEALQGKTKLHLVVLGHVDAGKSTLMGRLLHELGVVSQRVVHKHQKDAAQMGKASFAWAWLLDERPQERARGVTIDVASAFFETDHHAVTLLDAPGHRDFVPNMIAGAAQADAALLLVDGSTGNFEAGFEKSTGFGSVGGGQTREHAQLARSLGVDQIAIVVSKLDTCDYDQGRFESIKAQLLPFLKQCGFKESSMHWLPAVGILNENLVKPPSAPELKAWWSGPTLLQAIDSFNSSSRQIDSPLRLPVNDIFKGDRGGQSVGGKIEAGAIKVGTQVKVMPSGEEGTIKSIVMKNKAVSLARAGDGADVTFTGLDAGVLISGAVICQPEFPVPMVTKFEARVVVLDLNVPILRGQEVTVHAHAAMENGHISNLLSTIDVKTGETSKKKPRVLTKNQSAVIEVTILRAMCLELYSDCRALGRVILRDSGQTIAVGLVTKLL